MTRREHIAIHPAALDPERLAALCDTRRVRRSGPGGQHRNKVETGVVLCHRPTGVTAEATERRSQAENGRVALFRLRVKLALDVRTDPEATSTPSELWQSRTSGQRIDVSASHDDFPAILAEAIDVIAAHDADVKRAAAALDCTVSQLVKLLKKEPRAIALVNRWRRDRDLHAFA